MEPAEVTAAVVSGWAVTWGMTTVGIPAFPSIVAGLVIWATVTGRYRRHWTVPPPPATPAPDTGT